MSEQQTFIPYGRQVVDEADIEAVVDVLRSDWLTTGPKVTEFERAVASFVHASEGVAVSSGTAALHTAMFAIGIEPGDEVIVPTMTFAATANCVLYQGAKPVLVDVLPDTLLMDPASVEKAITSRTKAIITMDYAGQPCDYQRLRSLADAHELILIDDGCHALGAEYHGKRIGSLADLTCFSFHPVKHITTGEGGMVVTDNPGYAERMRRFRNHGIATDFRQRSEQGTWFYEMRDLGFNYRLSDIQCALGIEQLKKLPGWLARRNEIAATYRKKIAAIPAVEPLTVAEQVTHAYHLFVIKLDLQSIGKTRAEIFSALRSKGIGVNVHYIPVHWHPYYRDRFAYKKGNFPVADSLYETILSLPLHAGMKEEEVERVVHILKEVIENV